MWKLVPRGITVSAISSGTPIFLAHSLLTGIEAAEEQVAIEVKLAGITFFQNLLTPSNLPAIKAYIVYIIK